MNRRPQQAREKEHPHGRSDEEPSFRSFRHRELTEGDDAELTDAEIRAQSRQEPHVLPTYVKATEKQLVKVARKRRTVWIGATDKSSESFAACNAKMHSPNACRRSR